MKTLSLSLILVVVLTILGLGWGIEQYYTSHMSPANSKRSSEEVVLDSLGKSLTALAALHQDLPAFIAQWEMYSDQALTIIDPEDFPLPDSLSDGFAKGEPLTLESDGRISLYVLLPRHKKIIRLDLDGGKVSDFPASSPLSINLLLTLLFYGGVILVSLGWAYPLIRRLTRLRTAAINFGSGSLDTRITASSISYIADIEREFNRMADRIETLVNDNKLLSRAVSHDLKTPLARLRFGIETLAESNDSNQREKYFQRIEKDMDVMEELVETLLQYARLDESSISLSEESLDLNAIIHRMVDDYHHEVQDVNRRKPLKKRINIGCLEPVMISGDRKYIIMMVTNIFQNGLLYGREEMSIVLKKTHNTIDMHIDDDGPGIPASLKNDVLKPFIRGPENNHVNGHGMGLAIADRIASWHGASISIETSESLGGASIRIKFPRL